VSILEVNPYVIENAFNKLLEIVMLKCIERKYNRKFIFFEIYFYESVLYGYYGNVENFSPFDCINCKLIKEKDLVSKFYKHPF